MHNSQLSNDTMLREIERIYSLFCDRVIKDKKKVQANDLVSTFIGTMLDPEHYYQHPRKKNILVANDKQVAINGDQFELFMQMHSTEYSPKEKRIMTAISDRLIEDTNRRNKGEFYTPTLFVDYAHGMIEKELGAHWKENYAVWDCCCGTKNLTRDYRFKELYCSTLEQAELDISKNYNKEATSFQFDFLNDSLDDLKVKAPGLLEAFELNKPIVFFLNPPYGTAVGISNSNLTGNLKKGSTKTRISESCDFCIKDLLTQFVYRIIAIKKQFNISNLVIALFHKPKWLCSTLYKPLRKYVFSEISFKSGCLFQASEFSNVSSQWGIAFSLFGKFEALADNTCFSHDLIKSCDGNIAIIGTKLLYNTGSSVWTCSKEIERNSDNNHAFIGSITFKGNELQGHNGAYIRTDPNYGVGGTHRINNGNFNDCAMIFAVGSLINKDWINDKDQYLEPNRDHINYNLFRHDSIILSIFSDQRSYRDDNMYKNEFFWMSKQEMLDLAEEYNNDYTYEDALNSDERFVYLKLQEIKNDLSPEAKAVLDKATELVKKSFKYREMFNESHPEYQINNWDCGFYQIKALLKEFMPDDLKEFRALYKQLADKMRPMVYELGFLKK